MVIGFWFVEFDRFFRAIPGNIIPNGFDDLGDFRNLHHYRFHVEYCHGDDSLTDSIIIGKIDISMKGSLAISRPGVMPIQYDYVIFDKELLLQSFFLLCSHRSDLSAIIPSKLVLPAKKVEFLKVE